MDRFYLAFYARPQGCESPLTKGFIYTNSDDKN